MAKSKLTQVLEAKDSDTLLKIIAESSKILSSRVVNEEKEEGKKDANCPKCKKKPCAKGKKTCNECGM